MATVLVALGLRWLERNLPPVPERWEPVEGGQGLRRVERRPRVQGVEGDQSVEGTRVEQVPAEFSGHPAGDGALAGTAGTVDRQDRDAQS